VIVQASTLIVPGRSILVCLFTGELMDDPPFFRIDVDPTTKNGLKKPSQIMADLPVAILPDNMSEPFGALDQETVGKLNTALALILELS
jgi:mRNA interferase MazF